MSIRRFRCCALSIALAAALSVAQQSPSAIAGSSIAPPPTSWADPFCDVAVVAAPWDDAKHQPSAEAASNALVLALSSRLDSLSAHIILISDSDAYDVLVADVDVSGSADQRTSPTVVVTMPSKVAVRYAYIDSYKAGKGPAVDCATDPYSVAIMGAQNKMAFLDARKWSSLVFPDAKAPRFSAAYRGPLPPLSCGKPYIEASIARVVQPFYPEGASSFEPVTVQIEVYVDSRGRAVKTMLWQSSGSKNIDASAEVAAKATEYAPRTFLCVPIVGRYLFRADFKP